MRNTLAYKMIIGCSLFIGFYTLNAQGSLVVSSETHQLTETEKRLQNYEDLKSLGYTEKEIYQDLGNAHFLSHNYETALFWYEKLSEISPDGHLDSSYQKRYDHALSKLGKTAKQEKEDENWTELVKSDYHMTYASPNSNKRFSQRKNFRPLQIDTEFSTASLGNERPYFSAIQDKPKVKEFNYESPAVLTKDGKTAYFSKEVWVKPTTGIFSKKQKVHRIFRADKVNGEWKSIKELALCPKEYSALHPAISKDGTRLFFASNMPGTFGEFDIYVTTIKSNGIVGVAKNLGTKVNTLKNEMYPKVMEGNTLVFASEGHQGYGGLDVYMVEVEKRNVGLAMNMGSTINSPSDDFSIQFTNEQGMGYVMSNRGGNGKAMEMVAFSYFGENNTKNIRDFHLMEAMNTETRTQYSSSVFEDEN
ncbi:tetratricopeptide repeat protein [Maribacter cobaltidurans]|uniref:Uncharacterized protein n=1 Tax=Maribacter cobaltidurans TaxID=1178778 RepID=A0A223V8E8_9FLAO|nr:tetratricopeptide repeat protein [Maribacter cobaltidurans]ASV31683.1 hypothetical protein CJ263_16490 [Maribacter cobaltidurans]GGD93819.1 hypothetical protein GCM10011412_34790 [Maribacter cobaltidurans]